MRRIPVTGAGFVSESVRWVIYLSVTAGRYGTESVHIAWHALLTARTKLLNMAEQAGARSVICVQSSDR